MIATSPTISYEFFPPKTPEGKQKLVNATKQLAASQPHYFSVTFGAGGSTRDGTIETVKMLQQISNVKIAPHLSCIGSSREQIIQMLQIYQSLDVSHLVALRGDLPSGMGQAGELRYASDLVKLIRETTNDHFHIEVAAYPEIHPQALNPQDDVVNLRRKYEAGANSAITQYFYNPDSYFYYLDECAKYNINMPIIPGVMPIVQFTKLMRFSDNCGAEIPRWIRKRLEAYGDDSDSIHAFGIEIVLQLCERLLRGGAPGLHFYTLNQAERSLEILRHLKKQPVTLSNA